MEHAKLSPSGAHYWLVCPGALRICADAPELPDEEHSAEGTKAHALGAKALELGVSAAEAAKDFEIEMEYGEYEANAVANVQTYVDTVQRYFDNATKTWVEFRLNMEWLAPGNWGTLDAGAYHEKSKTVVVADYKNGVQPVDAEWNPQLLEYALGLMNEVLKWQHANRGAVSYRISDFVRTVIFVVIQPNAIGFEEPVKYFELEADAVMTWAYNVLIPGASRTKDPNAPLCAGAHCRWCDGKVICPELQAAALTIGNMKSITATGDLPDPEEVSPERLAALITFHTVFGAWEKQVKALAEQKALRGEDIPGFKLVAPKRRRVFKSGIEGDLEVLGIEPYIQRLISPNQAEEHLKHQGHKPKERVELLDGLWYDANESAEPKLAPLSDRRKEVSAPNVRKMFDDEIFG